MRRKIEAVTSRNVFAINGHYTRAPKKIFLVGSMIAVTLLIIFGFNMLNANWAELFSSFDLFFTRISELFKWDWEDFLRSDSVGNVFFNLAISSIFQTIATAFAGTIIGVMLAIPVSILAANNIVNNKIVNNTAKTFIAIFRTIPSFTYALIFVGYFGQSILTVTVVLAIFTFSITSKIFFERIEHINTRIFISQQATGAGKARAFRSAVVPQISNHITSATFYALETNIRYISVIGGVTRFGIGRMIDNAVESTKWGRVGFLLSLIVLVVIFLEILIYVIKKYILIDKDFFLDEKTQNKYSKLISSIKKMNNVNFYIKFILLKDLYSELEKAKTEKDVLKIKEIKTKMKEVKNAFIVSHKEKLQNDKKNFEEFKKNNVNLKDWFIWDQEKVTNIRRDKIYLTNFNFEMLGKKSDLIKETDEEALKLHEAYLKQLTINEVLKKNPRKWIKKICLYLLILILFIYSMTLIEFRLENDATIANTNKNIAAIFKMNWQSFFSKSGKAPYSVIYLLFETLSIAIVGTLLGAIFAYIFGLLSSENVVNYYVAKFFVLVTSIIRAVPTYIYAIFFITLVGMGPFTATLAISMGTIGMLTKYNREIFDDINVKILYQLESTGLNKFQRFKYGVMPQTTSSIISYIVYRFDINFKEVAVLGAVGAGNMGYLLNSYFQQFYFAEFGALLLGIILFTLFIEYVSTTLRTKINLGINPKFVDKIILFFEHRNFALYKANEALTFGKESLEFIQSEAFYSYTNKKINFNAKLIAKEKKISRQKAWYYSYLKHFDLLKDENLSLEDAKKIYLKHNLKFKTLVKEFTEKRKQTILDLKNEKNKQLLDLKTKSLELKQKNKNDLDFKSFKKEIKKSRNFVLKSTKIRQESLEY